ncbi:MAG: hypothetical protein NUW12_03200 [Firmicutes bacterium]|jgi:hypothetical protein|nr:hypothetical protein [Bacillota bacterium]MDH7495031.1 hypothetical protein [Bacillota bacterium]
MQTITKEELMKLEEHIKALPPQEEKAEVLADLQQLTFVLARATWFRQQAPEGSRVLWIASTDSGFVTRSVSEAFVTTWGPVIMAADQLWLGVDANSVIMLWQPGATF